MAIDFNKQLVFDPKIEIVGEEVPLAEMEKTGAVLQDRYDKSYEDYSTFKELAKQTEQIADREEREKVKQYIKDLEPQVKEIGEKGDFHNMRQQTAALAKNAAFNLKLFGERAAEVKKYRDLIAANDKIGDEETKAYYQNKLNKTMAETQYNPETKSFNFSALQLPKMVEDYDNNKFFQNVTQGWMANRYGSEAANMAFLKAGDKIPGVGGVAPTAGVYNTKTGRQDTTVDFNEVYNNVLKAAEGERGLQAVLKRDFEIQSEGKNLNPEQQEALKESLKRKYLYDPLTAFANKAAFRQTDKTENLGFDAGATNALGNGTNTPEGGKYTPVTINNPLAPDEKRELGTDITKSLSGDPKAIYSTRSIISSIIDNYTQKGDTKKAEKFTKYLNDITDLQNITQKYPDLIQYAKPDRLDNTGVLTMKEAVRTGKVKVSPEDKFRLDKISTDIGTAGKTTLEMNTWFDRELDDEYENFASTGMRNIGMMQPDLVDDATRNKIEALSKGLNIDAFNLSEGAKKDWGDKKGLDIVSWSVEPVGNGVGIVFGIKNPKTDEIIYTTPKNRKADGLIQQVSKYLYSPAAIYDQMSNLPSPTRKTKVSSLLKTAQLPKASFNLDVNDEIDVENGQYFTISNPGKKYDSIYQLFYDNLNR